MIGEANTALLLRDRQNEKVDPKGKVRAAGIARIVAERDVLQRAARALQAARDARLAVAHVRLGFGADFVDTPARALVCSA